MRAVLKRLHQEESGQVLVLFAVTLIVLFLFSAMALDFGRVHVARTQLQTAVDAASLAGAGRAEVEIVDVNPITGKIETVVRVKQAEARTAAQEIFNKNVSVMNLSKQDIEVQSINITFPAADSVKVSVNATIKTHLLGPIMAAVSGNQNLKTIPISRSAVSQAVVK